MGCELDEAPHTIPSDEIQLKARWERGKCQTSHFHSFIGPIPLEPPDLGTEANATGLWGAHTLVGQTLCEHRR